MGTQVRGSKQRKWPYWLVVLSRHSSSFSMRMPSRPPLVDARLVGDHHARLKDHLVPAVEALGAFMDVAHKADAVAGAAAVVDQVLPQGFAGDGVQHLAGAVVQPDRLGNVDVALEVQV